MSSINAANCGCDCIFHRIIAASPDTSITDNDGLKAIDFAERGTAHSKILHDIENCMMRMNKWRVVARTIRRLIKMYLDAKERMYSPGGKGYEASFASFMALQA